MSDYDAQDDFAKSLDVGYAAIRERMAAGEFVSHGLDLVPRVVMLLRLAFLRGNRGWE